MPAIVDHVTVGTNYDRRRRRAARGGSRAYYDKNKNTIAMRAHRAYKKELYNKGLVKRKDGLNGFF